MPICLRLAGDPSPTVRGMAVWALSRLMAKGDFQAFARGAAGETDADVRAEYDTAMEVA